MPEPSSPPAKVDPSASEDDSSSISLADLEGPTFLRAGLECSAGTPEKLPGSADLPQDLPDRLSGLDRPWRGRFVVVGLRAGRVLPRLARRGDYTFLAVFLAIATAVTVMILSLSYSRIIEHFPSGGGGYVVATKLLGRHAGVASGSALLVDYVLTISVSIASGADAVFNMLPMGWHHWKLLVEISGSCSSSCSTCAGSRNR
jgi:hypothetical protein